MNGVYARSRGSLRPCAVSEMPAKHMVGSQYPGNYRWLTHGSLASLLNGSIAGNSTLGRRSASDGSWRDPDQDEVGRIAERHFGLSVSAAGGGSPRPRRTTPSRLKVMWLACRGAAAPNRASGQDTRPYGIEARKQVQFETSLVADVSEENVAELSAHITRRTRQHSDHPACVVLVT